MMFYVEIHTNMYIRFRTLNKISNASCTDLGYNLAHTRIMYFDISSIPCGNESCNWDMCTCILMGPKVKFCPHLSAH